jgi:hypothetical protein
LSITHISPDEHCALSVQPLLQSKARPNLIHRGPEGVVRQIQLELGQLVGLQTQLPPEQVRKGGQTLPHALQLFRSVCKLVHFWLQQVCPVPQSPSP